MQSQKTTLIELEAIIKKMHLNMIKTTVLAEFGMEWRKVLHTVEFLKQPQNSNSLASVICQMAAVTIPPARLDNILARLQFIMLANQKRTWHALRLFHKPNSTLEKPPLVTAINLPHRVANLNIYETEVEAMLIEDTLYWTVRLLHREWLLHQENDHVVHCCCLPGEPIALFSCGRNYYSAVVQSCIEALGYDRYEETDLYGEDIQSLLRKACGSKSDRSADQFSQSNTEENSVLTASQSSQSASRNLSMFQKSLEDTVSRNTEENSVLTASQSSQSASGNLSMFQKSLEDTVSRHTEEAPVRAKSTPALQLTTILEATHENTASGSQFEDFRYVQRRRTTGVGRVDRTLMETVTVNLTIDSD